MRTGKGGENFLLNPQSLHADEVGAGSLLKVALDGNLVEGSDADEEDVAFHAALFSKNETVNAVVVISSDKTVAV